jgi:hypothetical protein
VFNQSQNVGGRLGMTRRIALWAVCGLTVAFLWYLYFLRLTWSAYHGGPAFEFSPTMETIVNITAPVRPLFGRTLAISWQWSLVLNAAIYACMGLGVELIRLAARSRALQPRR